MERRETGGLELDGVAGMYYWQANLVMYLLIRLLVTQTWLGALGLM